MSKSILVTGVSGSGKSTICRELKRRGYEAYDIEKIRSLFSMVQRRTGRVVREWDNSDLRLIKQMDWICNRERLAKLIHRNTGGIVFYCGTATNIGDIRDLFDQVLLLKCSPRVLRERLKSRATNDFARNPRVLAWVLRSKNRWESEISHGETAVVDANGSVTETTDGVLRGAQ